MDVNMVQTLISSLGFPIVMVGACGFFIWKMYIDSTIRNKEREEKLYTTLGEVNATNRSISETNKEISETNRRLVDQFTDDMQKVREDISDIKEVVLKEGDK